MPVITHRGALQRQQILLKFLGYYHGKCDGIWGPATIAAKRKFELSGKFNPGYPNNGQPFPVDGPFPSGIIRDPLKRGFITHVDITPEFIKANISELVSHNETVDPEPVEDTVPKADEFTADVSSTIPVEESFVDTNAVESVQETTNEVPEESDTEEQNAEPVPTTVVQQDQRPKHYQQHGRNRRF